VRCPECGSTCIDRNSERGELTCRACGIVIEENQVEGRSEWGKGGAAERGNRLQPRAFNEAVDEELYEYVACGGSLPPWLAERLKPYAELVGEAVRRNGGLVNMLMREAAPAVKMYACLALHLKSLRAEGEPMVALRRALNVSEQTAYRVLRSLREGVKPSPRLEPRVVQAVVRFDLGGPVEAPKAGAPRSREGPKGFLIRLPRARGGFNVLDLYETGRGKLHLASLQDLPEALEELAKLTGRRPKSVEVVNAVATAGLGRAVSLELALKALKPYAKALKSSPGISYTPPSGPTARIFSNGSLVIHRAKSLEEVKGFLSWLEKTLEEAGALTG